MWALELKSLRCEAQKQIPNYSVCNKVTQSLSLFFELLEES